MCPFANSGPLPPNITTTTHICLEESAVRMASIPSDAWEKQFFMSSDLIKKVPKESFHPMKRQNPMSRLFAGEPTSQILDDVSSRTSIQQSGSRERLDSFLRSGSQANVASYASILRWCGNVNALSEGKFVHAHIIKNRQEGETYLGNLLVQMYGKCGALKEARDAFSRINHRNVFSWTLMIGACARHGNGEEALQLFQQMILEGVMPNKVTFVSVLSICASPAALDEGKRIHARILDSGCEFDAILGTALVNMYGKCRSLEDAQRVFDEMPKRDVVSWNAMIAAYASHEQGKAAVQLFQQMLLDGMTPNKVTFLSILEACACEAVLAEGKRMHSRIIARGFESDVIMGNAIINMYGKCGSLVDARRMFDRMLERNVVSWTAIIAAYAQHGKGKDALQLFQQMHLGGTFPDNICFVSVLSACSHSGLVDEGFEYFVSMSRDYDIAPTLEHYNCVIDLIGRMGLLDEGEDLINNMQVKPSVATWTSLLFACKMHSDVERGRHAAEVLFELDPSDASPYAMLSSMYAAAGRWEDAIKVRKAMEDKGLKEQPGCSSIEVNDSVHDFFLGSESHQQKDEIYAELQSLSRQMVDAGYIPETMEEEEEKKHVICYHNEKLAIAFGLISTPPGTPLRIAKKSLGICCNCHFATEFISRSAHREVIVRDAYRFHHFKDGVCSCADCW